MRQACAVRRVGGSEQVGSPPICSACRFPDFTRTNLRFLLALVICGTDGDGNPGDVSMLNVPQSQAPGSMSKNTMDSRLDLKGPEEWTRDAGLSLEGRTNHLGIQGVSLPHSLLVSTPCAFGAYVFKGDTCDHMVLEITSFHLLLPYFLTATVKFLHTCSSSACPINQEHPTRIGGVLQQTITHVCRQS